MAIKSVHINKLLVSSAALLIAVIGFAQPYGNEWINYDQKHLKFPIVTTGVFRIQFDELSNAINKTGESISSISPANFQIFGRGQELYIHIEGGNDGSFDQGDFIEFYAKKK